MSSIYEDGTYEALHPTWHVQDSEWKAEQIAKLLERNSLSPHTICEIGCGAGEILRQLSNRMAENVSFVGWEVSQAAYELCRQRVTPGVTYHCGNPLESGSDYYDMMMAIDVVEHIEDYIGFLRRLRLTARYKVLHIPLDLSVYSILRNYPLQSRRGSGHLHYFTKEIALAALEDCGYVVKDYFYTAGSNELKGNPGRIRALLKYPRVVGSKIHQGWTVRLLGGYALMVLAE